MQSRQTRDRRALLERAIRLRKAAQAQRDAAATGGEVPSGAVMSTGAPVTSLADVPPRTASEKAWITPYQRPLWLAHQLEPESAAYNVASVWRVSSGRLNADALQASWQRLVQRHRILHSRWSALGLDVEQRLDGELPELTVEPIEPPRLAETIERFVRAPFDLARGPVVRATLFEADAQVLAVCAHHLVADEQALRLLWNELSSGYTNPDPARPAPPPRAQLDDVAAWQRAQLVDSDAFNAAKAYWTDRAQQLPELQTELRLPRGNGDQTLCKAWTEIPLAQQQHAGIERVSASLGLTPFVLYAFVFRLLLERWHPRFEQEPESVVCFGTPVSTRDAVTADVVGYFLNAMPVMAEIDLDRAAADSLHRFARQLRADLGQAKLPAEHLQAAIAPDRTQALYQAFFVCRTLPQPPSFDHVELEDFAVDLGAAKFDLTLFVDQPALPNSSTPTRPSGSTGRLAIESPPGRFERAALERLLQNFSCLLDAVTDALTQTPAQPLGDLSLWAESHDSPSGSPIAFEQGPELRGHGGTQRTIADTVALQILNHTLDGSDHCDRQAVLAAGEELTYSELGQRGAIVAEALLRQFEALKQSRQSEGSNDDGVRVAVALDRGQDLIATLLGTWWAGAAYVPLDPSYPTRHLVDVLEDSQASVLVCTKALLQRLPETARSRLRCILIDQLPLSTQSSTSDLAAKLASSPADHSARAAYILYTSGSTGKPKGVVVSHAALAASTAARRQWYGSRPERFALLSSAAFDSSVAGLFWTLATAGTLVVPDADQAADARQVAQLIDEHRVTDLLCIPSLWDQVLRFADPQQLASLRRAIVAGEGYTSALVRRHHSTLRDCRLFNEYGPTEATVWATAEELPSPASAESAVDSDPIDRRYSVDAESPLASQPITLGRPIPGVEVRVNDRNGRRVPLGAEGELWIAGPTLALGYWERPELTDDRFVTAVDGQRWYRSGDRARWLGNGRLEFLGRIDDQVKVNGVRIELGEVETALLALPGVATATAVVDDDGVIAAVCLDDGHSVPVDWRDRLAKTLARTAIPRRLRSLPELPELPNGKVDRRALATLLAASAADTASVDAVVKASWRSVGTPVQHALLQLWRGLLGLGPEIPLDLESNWFDLGGHSLLVVELCVAIEADLGVRLQPAEVFSHPTIGTLAERIENADAFDGSERSFPQHLFALQPFGEGSPYLMCIPHGFSSELVDVMNSIRPVYGLRGAGLRPEGNMGRWPTMHDLAVQMADEVEDRFPKGSFHIGGYSFGASMAVELARALIARGRTVWGVDLVAPMALDVWHGSRLQLELAGPYSGWTPASSSTWTALARWTQQNHPFSPRLWRKLNHWTRTVPRRRRLVREGAKRQSSGLELTPEMMHADVRVERFRLHRQYQPEPLSLPARVFSPAPDSDAAATWRSVLTGPFTVVPTADPHDGEAELEAARTTLRRHWRTLKDTMETQAETRSSTPSPTEHESGEDGLR